MSKTVCVIGSNSFSGASYCKYLLEQGYQVIGISRSAAPVAALLPYSWANSKNQVNFFQLDVNHHLPEIEILLDKLKPSHIYNFAAQSMVGQSWDFPEHWFMTNAVSMIKLHNMLRHKDYLDRYIHITTPEVYGSCTGYIDESQVFNPSTPYAVSRAAADMSLKTFFDVHQFPVISTRAANVYGEGQQLYRIVPRTILYILLGKKLSLHGGGHSERSFIHIDDVSAATHLIAERGKLGDCYHIATPSTVTIRELVELICQNMSADFNQVCEVSDDRKGKDAAYLLNTSKIRNELGWQDSISLDTGISRTIKWAQENIAVLQQQPLDYIHKA
ncbi:MULTISPECIES: GDP-mannose 4,6-dehydratase [Colwelliaceae]|uniref:GDP-mannose 4,6-dehydratase n=1 Tax=Colwelliaceae TaxID=267889 RepID=UPI0009714258|nr:MULTISPECIES: GDP-mannose 4,6-dehydratase [Colwelliaceae]